jgi:2-dehydropantoate 2-reductase
MRHAILGPGGVGGLIAASLSHCGDDVTVVGRSETLSHYPDQLHLESPFGHFTVPAKHAASVPDVDLLWITVKATQLDQALTAIGRASFSAVVPLLNGIDHVAALRARYGADRVIPATIAVETERVRPGYFVHRSPFARLNVASSGRGLVQGTIDKLSALGFTCAFVDREPTLLWSKLVFLGPLALVTTAANKTIGEIAADSFWEPQVENCVREACAVAGAEGATVNADAVLSSIASLPPGTRSSMQKDVERGNLPELDAIAGAILRGAARHGLKVPVTEKLAADVKQKASPPIG